MTNENRTYEMVDTEGEPLRVGDCYEVVHGPASSPERTSTGTLEGFDTGSNTYTFRLEDGSELSVVEDEIDGIRRQEGGC